MTIILKIGINGRKIIDIILGYFGMCFQFMTRLYNPIIKVSITNEDTIKKKSKVNPLIKTFENGFLTILLR